MGCLGDYRGGVGAYLHPDQAGQFLYALRDSLHLQ
jgi:hypothetical protein